MLSANYLRLNEVLHQRNVAFWGVGGRCRTILNNVSRYSEKNYKCTLFDSDKSKEGINLTGFDHGVILPSRSDLTKIDIVIIGTRVGRDSIINELKQLNYNGEILMWDQI